MTPQLQQAIRLLQLPTLELRTEIQQALDSNLMLEEGETSGADDAGESAEETDPNVEQSDGQGEEGEREAGLDEHLGDDLPIDSQWDDIYDGSTAYSQRDPADDRDPLENQPSADQSLRDYLLWQIELIGLSDRDLAIAETLIDAVREDGYLGGSLEDLVANLPAHWEVELEEASAVLTRIQHLDPIGVAARDPREALLIQLRQLPPGTPHIDIARRLVDAHLDLLVNRQYAALKRRLRCDQDTLLAAVALIRTLDPHPGASIDNRRPEYVVPDVFVRRVDGEWRVELNTDAFPRLRINSYYASLIRRADASRDNTLMREHLQEARWLIKSLRSRNDTLLRVAECIVERQAGFFEHGEEAMQPLVLREVAEAIEMHESTVSRITNQKFMHTPRGTLEFKFFFSSHVQTTDGGEASATAIRARIRRLIGDEAPTKPLSDSRIADILREEGINVARRTVAKYREGMNIPSSTDRKRLA